MGHSLLQEKWGLTYKLAFRPNTLFLEKLTHLSGIMRR
jgi:hypothetical protein